MTIAEQKKQREAVNALISAAENIEEKFKIAETWCIEKKLPPKIEMCNLNNSDVITIGLYSGAYPIRISNEFLTAEHIPFLINLINKPEYFWRNHERLELFEWCNATMKPKNPFIVRAIAISGVPSTDLIGKICHWSGRMDVSFNISFKRKPFFVCDEAPEGFVEFCKDAMKFLNEGVIKQPEFYTTVRYGLTSSGGHNRCEFDCIVNNQAYHVVINSGQGGGSADRPPRWLTNITITKIESTDNPIADIVTHHHYTLVFKNLANCFSEATIVWP